MARGERTNKKRNVQNADAEKENASAPNLRSARKGQTNNAHQIGRNFVVGTKPTGRGSQKAGKLAFMLEMPVDVFAEIAANLHPRDVLHLARSAKRFNELLMSKKSRPIWRAAFANIDAPKCPEDLNEPQYAALLFDTTCDGCGTVTKREPSYVLRLRLCKGCPSNPVRSGYSIFRDFCDNARIPRPPPGHEIFSLVPHKEPKFVLYRGSKQPNAMHIYLCNLASKNFNEKDFQRIAKEYFAVAKKGQKSRALQNFVQDRLKKVEEIERTAKEIQEWIEQCTKEKHSTKEAKMESFLVDVYEKMKALGYTERELRGMEYASPEELSESWMKYVFQPKELTDRIWKILRPKLVGLLEQRKTILRGYDLEKRRKKLNDLLCAAINTEGKRLLEEQEVNLPATVSRRRHLFVPVLIVQELGFEAADEFIQAKEEDTAYDTMQTLPEADWVELLEKGLVKSFDSRRTLVPTVLSKLLVEGVMRLDDDLLNTFRNGGVVVLRPRPQLPPCFSIHHAAAFLKYDRHDFYRNYSTKERIKAYDRVFTYEDAVWLCGKEPDAHQELCKGVIEWIERDREGGVEASTKQWLQDSWGAGRMCHWEGSRTAVELAMLLLNALGYDGAKCDNPKCRKVGSRNTQLDLSCEGTVSMVDMEAKGEVFVCMLCPEGARSKRTWKDLVQHYYKEMLMFKEAKRAKWTGNYKYIGTHITNYSPAISLSEKISPPVLEDATFEADAVCPYDKEHNHEEAQDDIEYICAICNAAGIYRQSSKKWRRCAETHVKVCHGIANVRPGHVKAEEFMHDGPYIFYVDE